jgi:hypothetical protein
MRARISELDIAVQTPAGEPLAQGAGIDAEDPGGQVDDRQRVRPEAQSFDLSGADAEALRNLVEGEQRIHQPCTGFG